MQIDYLSCFVLRWLLYLESRRQTNQWLDSLLSHDLLWPTCLFLLPNLSDLPVLVYWCWWIPLVFCALLVYFHNSGLFLQCMYCYSCGTESCTRIHLSGHVLIIRSSSGVIKCKMWNLHKFYSSLFPGDGSTQPVDDGARMSCWLEGTVDWLQLCNGKYYCIMNKLLHSYV